MHAVEFLKQPPDPLPSVAVLSGTQRHLKQSVVAVFRTQVIDDDETSLTLFDGSNTDLQTVTDELFTISMWGDRRLVVVNDADDFVSKNRSGLEKYVEKPSRKSVLVLEMKTLNKATRLAKQLANSGLEVECSELKGAALIKWLQDTARDEHQQGLSRDAANLLVELVGTDLGMLEQELSKLSSYVGVAGKIGVEEVRQLVGGWCTETTWIMTDAVRDGDLSTALSALDQLLTSGEPPLKLLGGIAFVFKKYAIATDLSKTSNLDQALRDAGVFGGSVGPSQAYLRRIGRARAEQILSYLLAADAGLKGASSLPDRVQLERMLAQLAGKI